MWQPLWGLLNDPVRLGSYATLAVAILAGVSLIVNTLLVRASFRQAKASRQAAEAAETSVELFRRELENAERAAFPLLKGTFEARLADGSQIPDATHQPGSVNGQVIQYGGTEPAREVEVVIRWRNYGVFRTVVGDLGPNDSGGFYQGIYEETPADAWRDVPTEFTLADPATAAMIVLWSDPAGERHWWAQVYSLGADVQIPRPKGHSSSGVVPPSGTTDAQ